MTNLNLIFRKGSIKRKKASPPPPTKTTFAPKRKVAKVEDSDSEANVSDESLDSD